MKIYVLRHGIAEDFNPEGDPARALTSAGRLKVEETAKFLKGKMVPELILTSPYVRAVQTAETAAGVWGLKKRIEHSNALFPGCESDEIIPELAVREEDEIVLVGHNPHLSYLVADFISSGDAGIALKKSSVTCIDFDGKPALGRGNLKWMLTPGVLGL